MAALHEHVFGADGARVFAILDGASIRGLLSKLYADKPDFVCLYRGELKPDLAEVAPYLVSLGPNEPFSDWVLNEGWGKHWGIFVQSNAELPILRQHLRRFLTVYEEQTAKPLLFRYYDPRVLRVYLPTCNAEELAAFFGPVSAFITEGETPDNLLDFRLTSGELVTDKKELKDTK